MLANAEQSVREGNLSGALEQLQNAVREDPANASARIFLFQLLAVTGNWKRALTQLNVAADMTAEAQLMGQAYRELLQCEGFRDAVFNGERAPLVFGEPSEWVGKLVQALSLAAAGNGEQAMAVAQAAFDQAPAVSGEIDGQSFEWLADADTRLGPVFEAIINGKYYWVPMDTVASVTFSEPEDLRDLVWLPAEFQWRNGGKTVGFVPSRYPGEATLADAQCALARRTEWSDLGGDYFIGAGQRCFSSDADDYPLLQTRSITFSAGD